MGKKEESIVMTDQCEQAYEEGVQDGLIEMAEIAEDAIEKWSDKPVTEDNNMEIITDLYQTLEHIITMGAMPVSESVWESEGKNE